VESAGVIKRATLPADSRFGGRKAADFFWDMIRSTAKRKECVMAKNERKVADCRLFPSEKKCSVTIAGTEDEVLEIAVQHAVTTHGHKKTPQLREEIRKMLRPEA